MAYSLLTFFLTFLLDVVTVRHIQDRNKDLEILLLRQQLQSSSDDKNAVPKFRAGRNFRSPSLLLS